MANNDIKIGKYKHYKGDIMEVVGRALHSETLEELVLYKHVSGERMNEDYYWVRPLAMFIEDVEIDGKKMPRFEYLGD